MLDEAGTNLCPHQSKVYSLHLVRVWPEWGFLEPGETMGVQVYLFAEAISY